MESASEVREVLKKLISNYMNCSGILLEAPEIDAIVLWLLENRDKHVIALNIHKQFALEADSNKKEGNLYLANNAISMTVQEGYKVSEETIIRNEEENDDIYTICTVSIPLSRLINIFAKLLLVNQKPSPEE